MMTPPTNTLQRWKAVRLRQPFAAGNDGREDHFLYGVTTTCIVCRPDCPSRRPREVNTRFFDTLEAAYAAGFRACLRCRPDGPSPAAQQAERVERVRQYIDHAMDGQSLALKDLAKVAGLSAFHLQRSFRAVLGMSPAQYARRLRAERLVEQLSHSSVLDAVYAAGYGSASAAYRASTAELGMSASARQRGGAHQHIRYAVAESPLGRMLVAATERGVCSIAFAEDDTALLHELQARFPAAHIEAAADGTLAAHVEDALSHLTESYAARHLPLDVRATAFQQRVWQALQAIPRGETRSYAQVAASLGQPTAARAVARACATNPVAVVIPCHRVVGTNGALTGYRWGKERKEKLLAMERGEV